MEEVGSPLRNPVHAANNEPADRVYQLLPKEAVHKRLHRKALRRRPDFREWLGLPFRTQADPDCLTRHRYLSREQTRLLADGHAGPGLSKSDQSPPICSRADIAPAYRP